MCEVRTEETRSRAWIELDMANLGHNVAVLRALLPPGCELMPAVKANAYGHGAVPVARELNRLGVRAFCVATAQEGAALREQGVQGVILVLGYTHPAALDLLGRYALTQTVVDYDYAEILNAYGNPLRVHISIDTGMHRLGERCENMDQISAMFRMQNLRIDGIFTHLCACDTEDPADRAYTLAQGAAFWRVIRQLRDQGFSCPKPHLLSSCGLLQYPELGGDYARVGIALYGTLSTPSDWERYQLDLRPVLSVKARIAVVKELRPGEYAGYGLAYRAEQKRRLAVLAIGYGDGLPRALSCGRGSVLIDGRAAPIAGRVCMDQTIVDVTEIPGARAGDVAVVLGTSGGRTISACQMAGQAGTIANEVLSRLGARLARLPASESQCAGGGRAADC